LFQINAISSNFQLIDSLKNASWLFYMINFILKVRYASSFNQLNKPLKFGQKLLASVFLYFMVIVKQATSLVWFYGEISYFSCYFEQEHCTVA